jgi:LPS export ABC transporter protein LptC
MGRAFFSLLLLIFLTTQAFSQIKSVKIQDFTYRRFEGSSLALQLKASYFEKQPDESFSAKNLELVSLKKGINIKAKLGFYDKKKELFHFQGAVELKTEKHGDVYTEELFYSVKDGVLRAPGRVFIKKEGIIVEGSELYYNLTTGEFRLKGNVKAKFSL